MAEIAISLAIIGIALVAIIGVVPTGVKVQKLNREETIVDQDATILMNAIRNGALGSDELTNYVFAVTNFWALYRPGARNPAQTGVNSYSYTASSISGPPQVFPGGSAFRLNSGTNIVALLSTPEYLGTAAFPPPPHSVPLDDLSGGGYSNHIVAYVHSISGPASEKPPQNNDIVRSDAFSYKVICENLPVPAYPLANFAPPSWQAQSYAAGDYVSYLMDGQTTYWQAIEANGAPQPGDVPGISQRWVRVFKGPQALANNLHELRLTFLWPLYPNGAVGAGRHTVRTLVAGRLDTRKFARDPQSALLYSFQPQSFTNAP